MMENADNMALDMLRTTGRSALYRGASGDAHIYAQVDSTIDYVGGEAQSADRRHVAVFRSCDVAKPTRGDKIEFSPTEVWILKEPLPQSDVWFHEWTATRK